MHCKHPNCVNKSLYNYEKCKNDTILIGYCEKHKKPGMIKVTDECIIL
jgi:hypothetical protein